jgi:flagellar protein FliS
MRSGYDQYRQTSIQTAPPEQLIVMLYDGAIRSLEQAKLAMQAGKDPGEAIAKAQDIFAELAASLNLSAGEIASNLAQLYNFWIYRLFQAQIHREPNMIDEVNAMARDLREAWATIAAQQRRMEAEAAATNLDARK